MGISLSFTHHTYNVLKPPCDIAVVFTDVRQGAGRTILDAIWQVLKFPSAPIAEGIKRAIAEKAIEVFLILCDMTWI